MKIQKIAGLALFILFLVSCMPYEGKVKTYVAGESEIIITPELQALLAAIPRPKIVIRVPNPPSNVTEAEKFNTYLNLIEKTFLQKGFVVRDRALLENLMRTGNVDYQSIQRTIDTDIIIDILSLEFDIPNRVNSYFNETLKQSEKFVSPLNFINCPKARLECRLTIVEKGQLGGLCTLYSSPCDHREFLFILQPGRNLMRWPENTEWFPDLGVVMSDESKRDITVQLTVLLANQLATKIQEASQR